MHGRHTAPERVRKGPNLAENRVEYFLLTRANTCQHLYRVQEAQQRHLQIEIRHAPRGVQRAPAGQNKLEQKRRPGQDAPQGDHQG